MNTNDENTLGHTSVTNLLVQYKEAAEGTSDLNPKEANKYHDRMHANYKKLRETEDGKNGIVRLMNDKSPHVRRWAAAHSLAWVPERAKKVLIALRDTKGSCSFDAEMTLREFEKGNLSFDY